MAEKKQFRAIKGVRDILPPESAAWNRVEQTAREVFDSYGYGEIRLPVFEQTDLFARSVGEDTDIVAKEMYTFADHPLRNLEGFKVEIRRRRLSKNNSSTTRMDIAAREFIRMWDAAVEDNEAPESPENQNAIEKLRQASAQFQATVRESGFEDLDMLAYLANVMQDAVGAVSFGDVLTLRPEATASVCRAYIEHGMQTRPGNVKLYYIGPMFRRERPQKGRYRQFYQIGAEVLTPSPRNEETEKERIASAVVDAEVIEMLLHFFARAGLGEAAGAADVGAAGASRGRLEAGGNVPLRGTEGNSAEAGGVKPPLRDAGLTLYYNSIGCRECRPKYVAELKAALEKVREQLGPDSQRRIETNPLRVLDSKVESEQETIETKLPRIGEHLCAACREHFAALKQQFAMRGIEGIENWRLVRGLDYYTRTTFEITAPGLGSQNAVCGGGRYDGLVELLGGPQTKGIGFAIGTDRVMLSLEQQGKLAVATSYDVYVAWMGAASQPHAIRLARELRDAGFAVEVPPEEMKFRKSLDLANRLGARYALIIGENEIAAGRYALKRLADATQRELTEGELVEFLRGESKVASG